MDKATPDSVMALIDKYGLQRSCGQIGAAAKTFYEICAEVERLVAQSAPQPNPILFHPDLVDREFGSHLIAVPKLTEWAAKHGLEVVTQPPIRGFQFVQAEAFLCSIENAARENTPEPMAAAIVQATPHLAHDRAAEVAPRWLVGADAHLQWRRLLERAVEAGELVLLHFGSKLPVEASTKPEAAPAVNRGTPKALTDAQEAEVQDVGESDTPAELADAIIAAGKRIPADGEVRS